MNALNIFQNTFWAVPEVERNGTPAHEVGEKSEKATEEPDAEEAPMME